MQDLNDKITGGTLSAAEWNQVPSELQNIIEAFAQVLSGSDLNQLGKGVAGYAGAGDFYNDVGVADAYVLGTIGLKQGPSGLNANTDGLSVRFRPGNTNTGASTVNVNGLGAKTIVRESGGALQAGDLATTRDASLRYDFANDRFVLQDFSISSALEVPRGYIDGIVTSNAADADNDITFGIGIARDSTDAVTMQLSSALTKQIDAAWAQGNNNGGFPNGLLTLTTNTWYHLFLIRDSVTGDVDAGFDSSLTAANLLAEAGGDWTQFRRVGAVYYDTSGSFTGIQQYEQIGDRFVWDRSYQDVVANNPGTGEVTQTLDYVPTGLSVFADVAVTFSTGSLGLSFHRISAGDQTLPAPASTDYDARTFSPDANNATVSKLQRTSTTATVKHRSSASNANSDVAWQVHGWLDSRGKDA